MHFQYPSPGPFVNATEALREVDGLLLPRGFLSYAPHLDLYHDRWVCLASADNAALGETLTMHDMATLPWVSTFSATPRGMTVLRQLRRLGVQVRVQAVVNGFLAVPFFITGTDRICLVPERIAQLLAGNHELRILDCPFETTPLVETLWWRPELEADAEHAWLRRLIAATVARDEMPVAV